MTTDTRPKEPTMPLADQADRAVRGASDPAAAQIALLIAAAVADGEDPAAELVEQYRLATAPPPPPKGRLPLRNFRCDDDLWQRVLDEQARRNDDGTGRYSSSADVLRDLIADHLPPRAEILET